ELETDDANVDLDRFGREAAIFARPVVSLDRCLEAAGDFGGFGAARKIRDQEAELVAAEPRVEVTPLAAALEREQVFRANLIRGNARDGLDDPIAECVAERVVVPLEAGDVDDPDAAPAHALLDGQKRLQPLHEPVEIEQFCLGIAV